MYCWHVSPWAGFKTLLLELSLSKVLLFVLLVIAIKMVFIVVSSRNFTACPCCYSGSALSCSSCSSQGRSCTAPGAAAAVCSKLSSRSLAVEALGVPVAASRGGLSSWEEATRDGAVISVAEGRAGEMVAMGALTALTLSRAQRLGSFSRRVGALRELLV